MKNNKKNNNTIEGTQLQHIGEIEKRLWDIADHFRANSNFASNEYFMPVMGMIFLRHAYSRFLKTKAEIEKTLPTRGGKTRVLTKEDFSGRGAIYLRPEAQFDHLVAARPLSVQCRVEYSPLCVSADADQGQIVWSYDFLLT